MGKKIDDTFENYEVENQMSLFDFIPEEHIKLAPIPEDFMNPPEAN